MTSLNARLVVLLSLSLFSISCAPIHVTATPTSNARTDLEKILATVSSTHAQCYATSDLTFASAQAVLDKCKVGLLQGLGQKEFTGLRDYFWLRYPELSDALNDLPDPPKDRANVSIGRMTTAFFQSTPREAESTRVARVYDRIVSWVSSRLQYSEDSRRFIVDLAVNTKPVDEATFRLYYALEEQFAVATSSGKSSVGSNRVKVQEIGTNSVMKGVYRGEYTYEVEREHYKKYGNGRLNLVDWSWTADGIICKLVTISAKGQPLPCVPQ